MLVVETRRYSYPEYSCLSGGYAGGMLFYERHEKVLNPQEAGKEES